MKKVDLCSILAVGTWVFVILSTVLLGMFEIFYNENSKCAKEKENLDSCLHGSVQAEAEHGSPVCSKPADASRMELRAFILVLVDVGVPVPLCLCLPSMEICGMRCCPLRKVVCVDMPR